MPGATDALKLPYPLGTEKLSDGDNTIQAALDKLDATLVVPTNSYDSTEPFTSWPIGVSTMRVGTTSSGSWPNANGIVITFKNNISSAAVQLWASQASTADNQQVLCRFGVMSGTTASWSDWLPVVGPMVPSGMASGQVTASPPSGGGTVAVPVTFPTGRFDPHGTPVRFSFGVNSHYPDQCSVSFDPNSNSATGFTLYFNRVNAQDTSINWTAVQGVDL